MEDGDDEGLLTREDDESFIPKEEGLGDVEIPSLSCPFLPGDTLFEDISSGSWVEGQFLGVRSPVSVCVVPSVWCGGVLGTPFFGETFGGPGTITTNELEGE